MDPPPPDDFNPYSLDDGSDANDDEGDDPDEYGGRDGKRDAPNHRPKRPRRGPTPEVPKLPHENSMYERAVEFVLSLIVPPRNPTAEQMRRHSLSLYVAVLGIYVHIAFACGWLASIGLPGFARADTVAQMQREQTDFRVSFYSLGIREFHHAFCNANTPQDQSLLNNQLERLRAGYQKEVGVAYVLPPCPPRE